MRAGEQGQAKLAGKVEKGRPSSWVNSQSLLIPLTLQCHAVAPRHPLSWRRSLRMMPTLPWPPICVVNLCPYEGVGLMRSFKTEGVLPSPRHDGPALPSYPAPCGHFTPDKGMFTPYHWVIFCPVFLVGHALVAGGWGGTEDPEPRLPLPGVGWGALVAPHLPLGHSHSPPLPTSGWGRRGEGMGRPPSAPWCRGWPLGVEAGAGQDHALPRREGPASPPWPCGGCPL